MFRIFINDGTEEIPKDEICYIIGKSGIFLKKKVGLIESIAPVKEISILEDIPPEAKINIPKIQGDDFAKIIDFFDTVYEAYSSEAIVLVFYNIDQEAYKFECPEQEVNSASLHYETMTLTGGYNLIGTIHSHGSMGAFHSGTDDHDEKNFDGIHITIGKANSDKFEISCSVVANGTRVINDPLDYIDGVELVKEEVIVKNATNVFTPTTKYSLLEPFNSIVCDVDWFGNVKKKVSKVYGYLTDDVYGKHFASYRKYFDKLVPKTDQKILMKERDALIDRTFLLDNFDDDDFAPCEECPFKNYKMEMMSEDELEEDDEDDFFGYNLPYIEEIKEAKK